MNNEIKEKLNDIIELIEQSNEYQKCLEIKRQMSKNDYLNKLIIEIKQLQKKVVRFNDNKIKQELTRKMQELEQIPIYQEYNNYLNIVNYKLDFIKSSLNEYFDYKLNNMTTDKNTN